MEMGVRMYDLDKYCVKREKVMGVRRRGISFGIIATLVSCAILLGIGGLVLPKAVAYFSDRNLADAIYKLPETGSLPEPSQGAVASMHGVINVKTETDNRRVIVTFDTSLTSVEKITGQFVEDRLAVVLLNNVGHSERRNILARENHNEAL